METFPPRSLPLPSRSRRFGAGLVLLLLAALALAVAASVRPTPAEAAPVRIMPLGDSITHGYDTPGGYRVALEDALAGGGFEVDFVGSLADGPAELADRDHEGHVGWRVDEIAARAPEWVTARRPQVVLLLIGTNDVLQNRPDLATAPQRLSALIDSIAASAPSANIFVASLPPLSGHERDQRARAYNAAISAVVGEKAAGGLRASFVDMHPALSAGSDLADGVHPNPSGYAKMAATWFAALAPVLAAPQQGAAPPAPPATAAPERSSHRSSRLVDVSGARLRVDSRGRVRLRVTCRRAPPATCSGNLLLRTATVSRRERAELASRRFRVRGERTASVRLALDRREQRRIRRRSSTRVVIETAIRVDGRRHATRTSTRLVHR